MTRGHLSSRKVERHGAVVVLVCILLPMMLALMALFVGVSQMQYARGQMRVAADATARAAVEAVLRTGNPEVAFQRAAMIASQHDVMNRPLILERKFLEFGQSRSTSTGQWAFAANVEPFNAARVNIEKSRDAASGAVTTLFPAFGPGFYETAQTATAAQIDHDVVIVMETGGSMHAPGRWEGVLSAIKNLQIEAQCTPNRIRIGLVACKNQPTKYIDLSDCEGDVTAQLEQLGEEIDGTKLSQGRNLGDGLIMASEMLLDGSLSGTVADQTVLFLGNGHHVKGTLPTHAAATLAEHGHVLYSLTFGNNADKNGDMEAAALITGGEYHFISNENTLSALLSDLLNNPSIVLIR